MAFVVPVSRAKPELTFVAGSDRAVGVAIIAVVLVIGLATAADYGITIDEFNTDDYGPKALAWYLSGFSDRSHLESVEKGLWYYGPWFQMLTAFAQSLHIADHLAVRHALTFVTGLAGLAAVLPIAPLSVGRWAGPVALILCLTTGYLYGNLFFAPIDVPFLAAMTWATLAIIVMARRVIPSWPATLCVGLATGLAIATRTGGIITHAYLILAMALCAGEALCRRGGPLAPQLIAIGLRTAAAIAIAWLLAIALWPWLQIGNPITQFGIAYAHFSTLATSFEFRHWDQALMTTDLPRSYIPMQMLVRLPEGFLILLAASALVGGATAWSLFAATFGRVRRRGAGGLRAPMFWLARRRALLIVIAAVVAPLGFLIVQRGTLYDGFRHVLFVLPMLATLAAGGGVWLVQRLKRWRTIAVIAVGIHVAATVWVLVVLHPLEYIAMNSIVGGVAGAYGRFELDYWSAAATEALRRLERRLDMSAPGPSLAEPPSIVICVPYREQMVGVMFRREWKLETDPGKATFVIASERSRCANRDAVLIDEVERFDRAFAWTYRNKNR